MTDDDPFSFVYDKDLIDKDSRIRLSVTVVDASDTGILVTLRSGGISIPFHLKPDIAMQLAAALTNAVCAYDEAQNRTETKSSETAV